MDNIIGNIVPGYFRILSLTKGSPPTGVSYTEPVEQTVHLNGPVTRWQLKRDGCTSWRLSLGDYPYTGIVNDKVTATAHANQNEEWIASPTRRGFTIQPIKDLCRGWTVDSDTGEVDIRPIITTKSIPPQYMDTQLFKFERLLE